MESRLKWFAMSLCMMRAEGARLQSSYYISSIMHCLYSFLGEFIGSHLSIRPSIALSVKCNSDHARHDNPFRKLCFFVPPPLNHLFSHRLTNYIYHRHIFHGSAIWWWVRVRAMRFQWIFHYKFHCNLMGWSWSRSGWIINIFICCSV